MSGKSTLEPGPIVVVVVVTVVVMGLISLVLAVETVSGLLISTSACYVAYREAVQVVELP